MKKIDYLFLVIGIIFTLIVCRVASSTTTTPSTSSVPSTPIAEKRAEETQKVINIQNEQLKKNAVKAVFAEINGQYDKVKGKAVFAEGKVSGLNNKNTLNVFSNFTLSQSEGNGVGIYHIRNVSEMKDLKDGDTVVVYGKIDEPLESGMPSIVAWIIEKK